MPNYRLQYLSIPCLYGIVFFFYILIFSGFLNKSVFYIFNRYVKNKTKMLYLNQFTFSYKRDRSKLYLLFCCLLHQRDSLACECNWSGFWSVFRFFQCCSLFRVVCGRCKGRGLLINKLEARAKLKTSGPGSLPFSPSVGTSCPPTEWTHTHAS